MHDGGVLVELGVILLGLGILARVATRLRLSPIPLYLLAGLAFGEGGFAPLGASEEFIEIAANIGIILLLLLLGLDYTAEELFGNLRSGIGAGVVDFVLNFTPGVVAAYLLDWDPLSAVVLGGITYISSSGVIAKVLGDFGRLGNRETPTILSVLVMEDLMMALYLPIVTGMLVGGSVQAASGSVVLAVLSAVVIMVAAVRFGPMLSRHLLRVDAEVLLLVILGLALMVSGLAEQLHVSAGVGAFLVGIALSGSTARSAHELLTPLRDLFAAVFFVFFGLQTDASDIPEAFAIALALAVVTAITKFITGWWAARAAGIGKHGRFRAGMALIARGEFSIVIAGLAVGTGVNPDLAPVAATYVLILAMVGPLLARLERQPTFRKAATS